MGIIIALLLGVSSAFASNPREQEIREMVNGFNSDPISFMFQLPKKWDQNGTELKSTESLFSKDDIRNREFISHKARAGKVIEARAIDVDRPRDTMRAGVYSSYSEIQESDEVEEFVGKIRFHRLDQMQAAGLNEATLNESPWSGDYWPIYAGVIAARYADRQFPDSFDWKENASFMLSHLNSSSVETLSPAEKYDLLVGDDDQTLTKNMINEGKHYYESEGQVEAWMGICHGWAIAAYTEPRPTKKVEILASDGKTKIPFFPADLKALASALWANGSFTTIFAGQRCTEKNPKTNSNGRVLDQECFDENPGAWHLAITHLLGLGKQSFVIDSAYDYQVWNQPLFSYRYSFFNPETGETTDRWEQAQVTISNFSKDKFREFRSPKTESVVGVAMDLTYIAETRATQDPEDNPGKDRRVTVRYLYDLELDEQNNIIGGEWYTNLHPDFLWNIAHKSSVSTSGDDLLDRENFSRNWDPAQQIPVSWKHAIVSASSRRQPLARIVKGLLLSSRLGL